MSVPSLKADIRQREWHVRYVPEADIQVLGPDSCSTLLSSIEIIREFQKAYGYDKARPAPRTGRKQKVARSVER